MKAARLVGKDDLRVEVVPEPSVGEGEVLVKVRAAMICGTDVRMLKNGSKVMPVTLGHELAGVIADLGPTVRGYQRGQPVAIAPNYGCGVCDSCVSGQGQHCPDLRAIGIHVDGAFAEYVRVPAPAVAQGNVCPIPDGLSFAEAALVEPLSCVYNSFERAHMVPGDSVLIVGAGPIGLLHAKLYRLAGAGQVLIHDLNEQRLADCARHDSSFVTVGADKPKERVLELTRGRGANVIVTAASSAAAQQLAFELAALDGRVIFFGGLPPGKEVVPLDTNAIHYRQITVTGTTRQSLAQYRRTLTLVGAGLVSLVGIISRTWPVEKTREAFEEVMKGRGLKQVVTFP